MEQKAKTEAELELWERDMLMLDEEEVRDEAPPEAEPCGEADMENFRFVSQNTGWKKIAKRESERTAIASSSAEVLSQSVIYLVGGEEAFSWTVEELIETGKAKQKEYAELGSTHAIIHDERVVRLQVAKELSELTDCEMHWRWRIMSRILLQQFAASGGRNGAGMSLEEYRKLEFPNEGLWKLVGEAERKYAKRTDDKREVEEIPWKTMYEEEWASLPVATRLRIDGRLQGFKTARNRGANAVKAFYSLGSEKRKYLQMGMMYVEKSARTGIPPSKRLRLK